MTQEEKDRLQYMIDVMQAYKDGKEIELKSVGCVVWTLAVGEPFWNWKYCDYRIKPEPSKPQYRPFENTEELIEAIKEHGQYLRRLSTGTYKIIREFDFGYIWIGKNEVGDSFASVYDNYTFADGTPFGKLIEK